MQLAWRRGGDKLGGVVVGETVIGIYCMRKESVLNKQKKENLQFFKDLFIYLCI